MTIKTTISPVLIQQNGWRGPRARAPETVRALADTLNSVQSTPGVVYTILKDTSTEVTRSVVRALRTAHSPDWTFRTVRNADETLDIQAMYDPTAPYVTRPYVKRANA